MGRLSGHRGGRGGEGALYRPQPGQYDGPVSWKRMLAWVVVIVVVGIALWLTGNSSPLR